MQGFPRSIDWETAERIYAIYSALYGTDQSLERLAERGGFGWSEVDHIAKRYEERFGKTRLIEFTKE